MRIQRHRLRNICSRLLALTAALLLVVGLFPARTLANVAVLAAGGPTLAIDPIWTQMKVGVTGKLRLDGTTSEPLTRIEVRDADNPAVLFPSTVTINGTSFDLTATLPTDREATYRVRVVGYNASGTPTTPTQYYTDVCTATVYLTVPDPAVITSPVFTNGTFATKQKTMTLTGTAQANAEVWVALARDGIPNIVKADANGKFTVRDMYLLEGSQALTVTVRGVGNDSVVRLTVVRDSYPPALQAVTLRSAAGPDVGYMVRSGANASVYVNQAGTYSLVATFSETLAGGLRGGKPDDVQVSGPVYTTPVTIVNAGSTLIPVEVTDPAGNSSRLTITVVLDTTSPKIVVQAPATDVLVGAPPHGGVRSVSFAGSASEPLSAVRVVDLATGQPTRFPLIAKIDPRDARRWTAGVTFMLAGTWRFRIEGIDLAGNVSVSDAQRKDIRTVIADYGMPDLHLNQTTSQVIYTGRENAAAGVKSGQLTVTGTLADVESGVQSVTVGRTVLAPRGLTPSYDFRTAVSLGEGGLTTITVTGQDRAGNQAPVQVIRAVLKSRLSWLAAVAQHDRQKQLLRISGGADRAVLIDGQYAVVVPVEITVATAGANGAVKYKMLLDGRTAEYKPGIGAFSVQVDTTGWAPGAYSVTVKGLAPVEFPGLATLTRTVAVTLQ